jgi:hypothetical protein
VPSSVGYSQGDLLRVLLEFYRSLHFPGKNIKISGENMKLSRENMNLSRENMKLSRENIQYIVGEKQANMNNPWDKMTCVLLARLSP